MSEERKFRPCCPNPLGCIGEDGCCSEPFTFEPVLEIRASRVKDCIWDTCGFLDPERGECDKTYYETETTIVNYANGSVETIIRNRSKNEGQCITTVNVECDDPNDLGCVGLYTATTTYSNPITQPISEPVYNQETGEFLSGECTETNYPYRPYRYEGSNFSLWEDFCNTIPYPEEGSPNWYFGDAAVNFDLTSNLCTFGLNNRAEKVNLKYRIRHHAQGTCYLKVWIAIFTQKQELVVTDPEVFPCCQNLMPLGSPTKEIVTYEWRGSGRPCFQEVVREDGSIDFTSCESVIYSEDFPEIIAEENEIKTVRIWKWSFVEGYEPNNPDPPQEIVEIWGKNSQGRYPNGFPIWPTSKALGDLSPATW